MWVRSLVREDPLEKGMETHSSILAWRVPWTEEPGELQSTVIMERKDSDAGRDWGQEEMHPWDFPGKSTGVGFHALLQGISPIQGSNLVLPHCRWIL